MEKITSKALEELPDDYEYLMQYSNKKLPWLLRYGTVLIALIVAMLAIYSFLFLKI